MNRMPYIRSPKSANIKIALLVIAILIVLGTLYYTQHIVDELVDRQREIADLYAKSLEYVASEKSQTGDLSFVFDEIIRAIDFPIIVSDPANNPIPGYHKNVPLDSSWSEQKTMDHLRMLIRQMDEKNPPIRITIDDTLVIQHVHFGEAELITTLRWLPYIEIAIAAMFVLIGYVGFSYIKRSEQSNIWVGMAKETAHQLGTPLSSIMGWIEILRMHANGNPKLTETVTEMEKTSGALRKLLRGSRRSAQNQSSERKTSTKSSSMSSSTSRNESHARARTSNSSWKPRRPIRQGSTVNSSNG